MSSGKASNVLEQRAPEDVGGEFLLSLGVLKSLLPIGRRELENAVTWPGRQEAQQIPHVCERLDLVQPGAGQQRDEDRVDSRAVVAANEHPVFAAENLPAQIQLADVVAQRQSAV